MPPLKSDLSIIVQDGLRGARYVFRKGTRIGRESVVLSPAVPRLAQLADSVLTVTEKAAAVLLATDGTEFASPQAFAQTFATMLATRDRTEFKALFVRIIYRLAQATLARLGVENAFISSHEIAAAGWLLRDRHRKTVSAAATGRPQSPAALARFWATTLVCLESRRAIREVDLPLNDGAEMRFLRQSPETYSLLVLVIAGATLTARHLADAAEPPDATVDECIDSAIAVVTARFERLAAHAASAEAIELLSADLEILLPFLP